MESGQHWSRSRVDHPQDPARNWEPREPGFCTVKLLKTSRSEILLVSIPSLTASSIWIGMKMGQTRTKREKKWMVNIFILFHNISQFPESSGFCWGLQQLWPIKSTRLIQDMGRNALPAAFRQPRINHMDKHSKLAACLTLSRWVCLCWSNSQRKVVLRLKHSANC